MMNEDVEYLPGQSPLPPEWRRDLLVPADTMEELNHYEAANIEQAFSKFISGGLTSDQLTDLVFLKKIHREMFCDVWKWAGEFRLPDQHTNIGVPSGKISSELSKVCDNTRYWIEHKTFSVSEIAVRYHHKLVLVHPFPNGNGRFSRFVANLLSVSLGGKRLPWGGGNLSLQGSLRERYLQAIYQANDNHYEKLLAFAESR